MSKYLKKFNTHQDYETFKQSEDYIEPNVSYCIEENEVYYNPYIPPIPNNVIIYEAPQMLVKGGWSQQGQRLPGYEPTAFNSTIISHTFENGKGQMVFEDDLITIGDLAFSASEITNITIPNSVTSIGDSAFWKCSNLLTINLPNSITTINNGAFSSCSSLTSIIIPNSVTSIGSNIFSYCNSLRSIGPTGSGADVEIPSSITSIPGSTFLDCINLTNVVIPDTIMNVGYGAFARCTLLPVINDIRYADTYAIEIIDKTKTSYTFKEGTRFIS